MELGAAGFEPALGLAGVGAVGQDLPPEPRTVVHFEAVGHFVGGHIIKHKWRGQNQAPGIGQIAGR